MPVQIPQTPAGVNTLLNHLLEFGQLKNDAALSRTLEVAPAVISKLRHAVVPLGAKLLLEIHLWSDISVRDLMALLSQGVETAAV